MTVSVIIPNYNHSEYLKERIDSVLNQTFSDFELIILDDCSTDNSREIIEEYRSKYPEIITLFNSFNSGSPFSQWNLGVGKAKGKYIWIAESDDVADPLFLETMFDLISKSDKTGIVYCNSKVVDERTNREYLLSDRGWPLYSNRLKTSYVRSGVAEISDFFFLGNGILNVSSVLFRRSCYVEAVGADSSMRYCGDWLLWLSMLRRADIAYNSSPLNKFRLHSGSTFTRYFRSNQYLSETLSIYRFVRSEFHLNWRMKILIAGRFLKLSLLRFLGFIRFSVFRVGIVIS
jgi:glycosyltransferase involved in cell wall biosynthesis